jgi:TetR/AcrR family transcriptional repressor of nem operon
MDKREKIISISSDLFHKYGYNSVGLSAILKAVELPKGSFYYYFSSKEDLLIEVIRYFINETIAIFNRFPKSIKGLFGFFQAYFDRFESLGYTRGCPIGNFALELSDVNERARQCIMGWTQFLEKEVEQILIEEKFEAGEAASLSSFIVAAFEGVMLKAKIEKSNKSLEEFNYFIFKNLLSYKEL